MTADVQPAYECDESEARTLTDEIKGSVERTWRLLLNAHEWKAWAALGYPSWREYAQAEFGMSQSYAYRLLDTAKVALAIESAAGSPMGELSEREARDLKPHLADVTAAVAAAVTDVPESERPAAAAAAVKDARARLAPPRPSSSPPSAPALAAPSGAPAPVAAPQAGGEPDVPFEQWERQQPNPLAAARSSVAKQPAMVAGTAIDYLRRARLAFAVAGTPAEVIADLVNDELPDGDRGHEWLRELDAALPVLNDLAGALRRRNLRSVQP